MFISSDSLTSLTSFGRSLTSLDSFKSFGSVSAVSSFLLISVSVFSLLIYNAWLVISIVCD